jgi:hypothetical protein
VAHGVALLKNSKISSSIARLDFGSNTLYKKYQLFNHIEKLPVYGEVPQM